MSEGNLLGGRRILVTGASGFIGRHLARALARLGAEVHGVSRRSREPGDGVACWWRAELADPAATGRLLADAAPDVVYHLASEVVGSRDLDAVLPTFAANLQSTVNLLVHATAGKVGRVVLAGSLEEAEGPDAVPVSPYAAAKWAAAAYARMCHTLYGTRVVLARLYMVYGPGQQDLRKLVPYVARALLRGEPPLLGSGTRQVDWVYVEDVAGALVQAGSLPDLEGKEVDIGSGETVTVRRVVEMLAEMVDPKASLLFGAVADRPMERVRTAEVGRAEAWLRWRAATALRPGLERTVAWYREHPEG